MSGGAVNVVTTISSNDSANASTPPASNAPPQVGKRDQPERRHPGRAEVHRRLLDVATEPAQPRDDVVEDDDDAERRVRDHQRPQREVPMPRMVVNALLSAIAVTMPGSAIGRMISRSTASAAEEAIALQRERRERAEDERDRGGDAARPGRSGGGVDQAGACAGRLPPLEGEARRRPRERAVGVERVDHDDGERHVDEREREDDQRAERPPR